VEKKNVNKSIGYEYLNYSHINIHKLGWKQHKIQIGFIGIGIGATNIENEISDNFITFDVFGIGIKLSLFAY